MQPCSHVCRPSCCPWPWRPWMPGDASCDGSKQLLRVQQITGGGAETDKGSRGDVREQACARRCMRELEDELVLVSVAAAAGTGWAMRRGASGHGCCERRGAWMPVCGCMQR